MNPIKDGLCYNYAILAGEITPGIIADPPQGSNPRSWDEKKGAGMSGATLVYSGDGLAKFSLKLQLWEPFHFDEWEIFKPILKPPTEKKPQALDFYYAGFEHLPVPIHAVVVDDVIGPTQVGDSGLWVVEIKLRQYRAPAPAQTKAKGAAYTDSKGKGGKDAADQMIDGLLGQAKGLL